jgi:hypothetical protein
MLYRNVCSECQSNRDREGNLFITRGSAAYGRVKWYISFNFIFYRNYTIMLEFSSCSLRAKSKVFHKIYNPMNQMKIEFFCGRWLGENCVLSQAHCISNMNQIIKILFKSVYKSNWVTFIPKTEIGFVMFMWNLSIYIPFFLFKPMCLCSLACVT